MQTNLDPERRTAATLAPKLEQILRWCEESDNPPSFLSVADGPGSFTGLRIGVTTAKTLCYALNLPLVAVDSLASIAAAAAADESNIESIWSATDAYRGQVFFGKFERSRLIPPLNSIPDDFTTHPSTVGVTSYDQWHAMLEKKPDEVQLCGDEKPYSTTPAKSHLLLTERECDAVGVGLIGLRAAVRGQFTDPLALVPRYLKPSAAEEKLQNRR